MRPVVAMGPLHITRNVSDLLQGFDKATERLVEFTGCGLKLGLGSEYRRLCIISLEDQLSYNRSSPELADGT